LTWFGWSGPFRETCSVRGRLFRRLAPIVRFADPGEYRELLRAKLVEEAHEVATADDAHVPEESADVLEVVLALAADLGLDASRLVPSHPADTSHEARHRPGSRPESELRLRTLEHRSICR
jgi:predicted house-cleaning noncanonical NTP pyrophosphatase (MazG superfamily)